MIAIALIALVATIVIHEAGHAASAAALQLPWRPTLTRHGPGIVIGRADLDLTRRQVVLTAAGGPAANLAAAYLALRLGLPLFVLMGLLFAVMNLAPFPRSDGSRMLRPGRAIARAKAAAAQP